MSKKNKSVEHLLYAEKVSKFSKDKSTKVGAVFFDETDTAPISFGYNGMPRGMDDNDPVKTQRPEKYDWFEHAERNGLYNAAQSMMKDSIMFTSAFPNMEAARAIVSSAIEEVVFPVMNEEKDPRVIEMFENSGIKYIEIDMSKSYSGKMQKLQNYLDLAIEYGITDSHELAHTPEGVLIMNKKTFSPIASGATRPPININIDLNNFSQETAHMWIQEAEKDAIFNALRPKMKGSHAYVNWCPCSRCSLALISVDVKKIITKEPDFTKENDKRWQPDFERTLQLLKTMKIDLELIPQSDLEKHLDLIDKKRNKNKIKFK